MNQVLCTVGEMAARCTRIRPNALGSRMCAFCGPPSSAVLCIALSGRTCDNHYLKSPSRRIFLPASPIECIVYNIDYSDMPIPPMYRGARRRLIISFDIGTTFSGISYCILEPGRPAEVRSVDLFLGYENAVGNTRIPSVIYYDSRGRSRAVGAQTLLDENIERLRNGDWRKVSLFKLHLLPKPMVRAVDPSMPPALPRGLTIIDVLADLLSYLMTCAETFILHAHPSINSDSEWAYFCDNATFVIAIPSCGIESIQSIYRRSAIQAGLIPNSVYGRSRVVFVSEGEACLHYCVRAEGNSYAFGKSFIVIDLGGGTIDVSAYKVTRRYPLLADEINATESVISGSTFVTKRAATYLREKFENTQYASEAVIDAVIASFDNITKRLFRSPLEPCFVPFGSPADNDSANDVQAGKLKLSGHTVVTFFEHTVSAAVNAVVRGVETAPEPITAVYLVGGFSANPYLREQIRMHLKQRRMATIFPDGHSAKAVAEGSLIYYIERYVTSRVAKFTIFTDAHTPFIPTHPDHKLRMGKADSFPNGIRMIPGHVECVLERGTCVSRQWEFHMNMCRVFSSDEDDFIVKKSIMAYAGKGQIPQWIDEIEPSLCKTLCTVSVDLSSFVGRVKPSFTSDGEPYKIVSYDVVVLFGGPETGVRITWLENGVEHHSTAVVIYEDADTLEDEFDALLGNGQ